MLSNEGQWCPECGQHPASEQPCLRQKLSDAKTALKDLLDKLDVIFESTGYKAVFIMAYCHGVKYLGPHCAIEMEVGRHVIAAIEALEALDRL